MVDVRGSRGEFVRLGAIARIGAGGAGTLGLSGAPHLTTSTPGGSKV